MFFDIYNAFTPIGHIAALASALIAFGLLPGALTLVFLALQRHAAEVASELARYHPPREGHRLLEATVEEDGDSLVTLRVDMVRRHPADHLAQGERPSRGSARPFRVRDESGTAVRVDHSTRSPPNRCAAPAHDHLNRAAVFPDVPRLDREEFYRAV